jgi:capsular polysaccharide biosynthesis protein
MRNILIGFVLGIIVSTVGFTGVARMLDHGVETVKTQSQELAK